MHNLPLTRSWETASSVSGNVANIFSFLLVTGNTEG